MVNFGSVNEALDFAIKREEESEKFYNELAAKAKRPGIEKLFKQFAKEEKGHKSKLLAVKKGKQMISSEKKVLDLKIADYVVDVKPGKRLSYQDALIVAMKKEKAAFKLYNNLATASKDKGLAQTFLALAQEEAKHKLRFEVEYDEYVLTEN